MYVPFFPPPSFPPCLRPRNASNPFLRAFARDKIGWNYPRVLFHRFNFSSFLSFPSLFFLDQSACERRIERKHAALVQRQERGDWIKFLRYSNFLKSSVRARARTYIAHAHAGYTIKILEEGERERGIKANKVIIDALFRQKAQIIAARIIFAIFSYNNRELQHDDWLMYK